MNPRAARRRLLQQCWGLAFVAVALAAALLGLVGIAAVPASAAWTLVVAGAVFAAVFFGTERSGAA